MACEMRLTGFAAKDLVGVQVCIVDEAHRRRAVAVGRTDRWSPRSSQQLIEL